MTKLFALESIQEIAYTEPAAETEAASTLINTTEGGEEVVCEQEELGNALCVAETLDAIGEQVEKAQDGFSVSATKALNTALEHLCNIDFGDNTKFHMVAVEEFSTYRAKKQASMESLEQIKEFGKRVWEWIKKLIKDVITSIKRIFKIQTLKQKQVKFEINSALDVAEKSKGAGVYTDPAKKQILALKYDAPGFKDKAAMLRLSTHGRFMGGQETITDFKKHHEHMSKLENGFLRIESDVIRHLESAMRNIFTPGKDYSRFVNAAVVAVTAPLSGHQIPNRRALPDGVRTFETPMTFGNMSIYREAVIYDTEIDGDVLRTTFAATSGTHDPQLPEAAPFLSIGEIEQGLHAVRERWASTEHYVSKLLDAADNLESLEKMVGKVAIENTDDKMIQRRARRILSTIHAYLGTRRVFANALVSYNHAVMMSLVTYCSKSNIEIDGPV